MLVDCLRRKFEDKLMWVSILGGSVFLGLWWFSAILYYFLVYQKYKHEKQAENLMPLSTNKQAMDQPTQSASASTKNWKKFWPIIILFLFVASYLLFGFLVPRIIPQLLSNTAAGVASQFTQALSSQRFSEAYNYLDKDIKNNFPSESKYKNSFNASSTAFIRGIKLHSEGLWNKRQTVIGTAVTREGNDVKIFVYLTKEDNKWKVSGFEFTSKPVKIGEEDFQYFVLSLYPHDILQGEEAVLGFLAAISKGDLEAAYGKTSRQVSLKDFTALLDKNPTLLSVKSIKFISREIYDDTLVFRVGIFNKDNEEDYIGVLLSKVGNDWQITNFGSLQAIFGK